MIDIHAHILPDVDDGSSGLESSIEMAQLSVESSVKAVIATPHCDIDNGEGIQDASHMRAAVYELRNELRRRNIPLLIFSGMEIYGTRNTADYLKDGQYATLADSRYPLIEFSFVNYALQATRILASVISAGFIPIVAHPERYRYVCDDPQLLNLWTDMGCLLQLNRGSLFGRFGTQTQALAHGMLERGFVSFIASDAHGSESRTTWMKDVLELVYKNYSKDIAKKLLHDNPISIIKNEKIEITEPEWF